MKYTFPFLVEGELRVARQHYDDFDNHHHGYAVILEELESFRLEVFKPRHQRNHDKMRLELIQVAAMAQRVFEDLLQQVPDDDVTDLADAAGAVSPPAQAKTEGGDA